MTVLCQQLSLVTVAFLFLSLVWMFHVLCRAITSSSSDSITISTFTPASASRLIMLSAGS